MIPPGQGWWNEELSVFKDKDKFSRRGAEDTLKQAGQVVEIKKKAVCAITSF